MNDRCRVPRHIRGFAILMGLLVAAAGPALAQVPGGKTTVELQADKELLARIAALPDNTWLKLPKAKTAGELSWAKGNLIDYTRGPAVRDYCNRMVWAPERRRALYCGAGHNIHPWNDVWEYDLAANTWVCLYAPDPDVHAPKPKADDEKELLEWYRKNYVYRDGVITTRRGAPVRPAHTWWGLCYDTDRRRLVFWEAHKGQMFMQQLRVDRKLLAQAFGLKADDKVFQLSGSGPGEAWVFTFAPDEAVWKEAFPGVPKAHESSQLEYLPDRKLFWLHSGQTYLSEPALREWKVDAAKGGPGNVVSAYDPESHTVVAAGAKAWVYSCAAKQWAQKADLPEGDSAGIPSSVMTFDTAAKRFVLYTQVQVKDKSSPPVRLWLYDLKADSWSRPKPQGEVPPAGAYTGYYDPTRNVSVCCNGRDGVWVYRCKKAE